MARCWLVLAVTLVVAATAAADPAAEAVRDNVRKAVGYDAFRRLEHGVLIEGKVQDRGLPGTFRTRLHPDGRYAEVVDTQAGAAAGFDGKARWARLFTNPALPADLAEGDRQRFRYGLVGHRWLAPDGGFTVTTDPDEHRPYQPCLVVRHPDAPGVAARVYVDPTTWLPIWFSLFVGHIEWVVELSDYRDVSGAKVAGRVILGRLADGCYQIATTVVAASPPPGADPFAPLPTAADTRFDPAVPPAVEARLAKGVLLVRPAVNGKPGPWLAVSTAASVTALATSAADRLGLPVVRRGPTPRTSLFRAQWAADRFALGPVAVSGLVLAELPAEQSAEMGRALGADVGGLLGADVLSRVVLETDFVAGAVAVHAPGAYPAPAGMVWEPARFNEGVPYLSATFEGKHTGPFQFATVASDPLQLNPKAIRALDLLAGRQVEPSDVRGVSGVTPAYRGTGAEFRVLGRTARSIETRFRVESFAAVTYPYCLGAFGPTVLGPGTTVFDYPNRRIGFAPRP